MRKFKKRYELPNGRFSLRRTRDGAGDSGGMLNAITLPPKKVKYESNVLEIGKACQCGSLFGRSYSGQDWWLTTPITHFLEVDEDKGYFKFETQNSTYELRVG